MPFALPAREALSGVCGYISLVSWLFVLVPQLVENYRCGSAEGLSLAFLAVWFIGDLTNLIGAIWAGLVPTVIAIAIYFCITDAVLIIQCLYYRRANLTRTEPDEIDSAQRDDPRQPLLIHKPRDTNFPASRRRSSVSQRQSIPETSQPARAWVKNTFAVLGVFILGAAVWAVAWQAGLWEPSMHDPKHANQSNEGGNIGAVVLGYFSAVCYLGARIPQIMKNFKERSCEGLALLFFILSLLGNLTYGGSIVFHSTSKAYMLTNLPWLIGSLGTMGEDITIFVQFRIYANKGKGSESAVL